MNNRELLAKLEQTHRLTAQAILDLRELARNENKFTEQAANNIKDDILNKVQLNITEFEILEMELEAE